MLDNVMRLGRRIAGAFAAMRLKWRGQQEFAKCDVGEINRMARELGFTPDELRLLADSGSGAADLLYRRLDALGMDSEKIKAVVPEVMRDMQRCCSECISKRRCAGDFDAYDDSRWRDYCPNAGTLAFLKVIPLR
jgi:hypothetical protein